MRTSFSEWTKTLWREINVEQLDMDVKKFAKDIRGLDREMRAWDVSLTLCISCTGLYFTIWYAPVICDFDYSL